MRFIAFILLILPFPLFADSQSLTVGIVPQQSASKLARLWMPLLKHLSHNTGYQLNFRTANNIPTFEQRVADGKYDIAYMNPYHYTVFHKKPGYIAFAKEKNKHIQGVVVVRKDSPLQDIIELKNQSLAFPAPAAFAASVLPRSYFRQNQFNITPKYVSSHDSVYYSVAQGLYPAGGGVKRTFNNVKPQVREQLRILWTTEKYTPHAFAAHPRVSGNVLQTLAKAMFVLDETETGKQLLSQLNFKGIAPAEDQEWDDVRALKIELLNNMIDTK